MAGIVRTIKNTLSILIREKILLFALILLSFILLGGGIVFLVEFSAKGSSYHNYFDALWWAVVTVTGVGYGDLFPIQPLGRLSACVLMFAGITMTSLLSGTIASIIVDKKLKEEKGLEDIIAKRHIIICGWNRYAEKLIAELNASCGSMKEDVVLINESNPEDFQMLRAKYPGMNLRFVRGDFVSESVLRKANSEFAQSAIILADSSRSTGQVNADERTILAALALKSLNPDVVISAELLDPNNEQHLNRANVENILVYGEYNGFLLASGTQKPGMTQIVREILSGAGKNSLTEQEIPAQFVGKKFRDLSEYFLENDKGILVGFLSQEKKMTLSDILSDDSSAIDDFIKRKFHEAEIDIVEESNQELQIKLNPGAEYIIKDTDVAFTIGKP